MSGSLLLREEMIVMDNRKPVRSFIQFLWPSMLTMIMLAVYTFADTFVVGRRLGSTALGAMGVCTPVLTVTYRRSPGFRFLCANREYAAEKLKSCRYSC